MLVSTGDGAGEFEEAATIGHNFEAVIGDLETRMRAAAADLDFEEAARLRDEIKRLRSTELAVMDDPTTKIVALSSSHTADRAPGQRSRGGAKSTSPRSMKWALRFTTRSLRTGPKGAKRREAPEARRRQKEMARASPISMK